MVTIRKIKEGDYDDKTRILTLRGRDNIGRDLAVGLTVEDPEVFLGFIAGVLYENQPVSGKGIVVTNIGFGLAQLGEEFQMTIELGSGPNFRTKFVLPMGKHPPERMHAIQSHLEEVLKEMETFQPVGKH